MRVPGPHAMTSSLFTLLGAVLVNNNVALVRILELHAAMGVASTGLDTFKQ